MFKLPQCYVIVLLLSIVIYLGHTVIKFFQEVSVSEIDELLEENNLGEFKSLFRECEEDIKPLFTADQLLKFDVKVVPGWQFDDKDVTSVAMLHPAFCRPSRMTGLANFKGIVSVENCGSLDQTRVAEMPAEEEMKVRRAADLLQQKLILRQWLSTNHLVTAYPRLISLDVCSIEDVYWLEDNVARHSLDFADFPIWSAARQTLPISPEHLHSLKTDLWSAVVKNSRHQDAWAWGGMLVVSASMAGLVTLAALTQPALTLAPEARTSLLHYVTGRYLHPPSCKVELGWEEPGTVGETLSLKVLCYQRDGQPYPVSDADQLLVTLRHRATEHSLVGVVSLPGARAHEALVYFRTQAAGDYDLCVTIGPGAAGGGPRTVRLVSGAVSARRCRAVRPPGPLAAARAALLHVLARDHFDNAAAVTPAVLQKFKITFTSLEGEVEESLGSCCAFSYDAVNERVVAAVYFAEPHVYCARIYYGDEIIANGEFDCIVLTPLEAAEVTRCLSSGRTRLCVRAYEWPPPEGPRTQKHPRRLTLRLTSRALSIQSYWLNVIPQPPQIYPITHYTKLVLEADSVSTPGVAGGQFSVTDGGGSWRKMWSPRRDVLAATLQALRQHNDAHSFTKKQEDLYESLRRARRGARGVVALRVSRAALLSSSLRAVSALSLAHWRTAFHITFEGEQGVDWGGLSREWFSLICRQLFAPETGLFHSYKENGLVLPRPHTHTPFKLKVFETAGRLVGKCVLESSRGAAVPAPLRLARSLLAQLQRAPVTYQHFEQDDPELYMTKIKYILESDLENDKMEIYFTDDEYKPDGTFDKTHDLVPNGSNIRVTNANKILYLTELARWRLSQRAAASTRAFIKGVHSLIPANTLQPFNENELERAVCGRGRVCAAAWRAGAASGGVGARLAAWFWAALHALSGAERRRLLQFATGSAHLPPNGFQDLHPRFHITPSPSFNALPTAHTCFNQLCLPDYESYEHLLKALLTAINEGEGFGMV